MLFNSSGGVVEHYRVRCTDDNKLTLDEEVFFENLTQFVEVGDNTSVAYYITTSDTYLITCIVP